MTVTVDKDLLAIQEMRTAVKEARSAQQQYMSFSQEQVDAIVKAVADTAYAKSAELGKMASEETGMGVPEHKKIKNEVGSRGVYESIKDLKTVGIIGEDKVKKVVEIAAPFGVVAAIIPTTNPTSTAFFKTLISLKTRNAIVVSPHPYAVKCTKAALDVCNEAAVKAGAPPGLIQCLTMSSMEATQKLMTHSHVNVILATGGSALVKAAYSSGKPAYGVGPGNVPAYIERTAKIEKAVEDIIKSKSFDYGTICATEQSIIVDHNVKEQVLKELRNNGAYILSTEEKQKMERIVSPAPGKINPKIVGRSPQSIADLAGVKIPSGTRILVGEETEIGKDVPFSMEKLSPILALYTARDSIHAKELCLNLLYLGGRGHSLSLHTQNDDIAREFAVEMPVSRILVNTMSSVGAVGGTTGLLPSMTLGCGTFGGNITSDNVSANHLINIKRIAYGIKELDLPGQAEGMLAKQDNTEQVVKQTLESMNQTDLNPDLIHEIVSQIVKQIRN